MPEKISNPDSVTAISPVIVDDTMLPFAASESIPDSKAASVPLTSINPDAFSESPALSVTETVPEINTTPLAASESVPDSDTPSDPATITEPDALAESLPSSVTAKLPDIAPGEFPKYSCQLIG